MNLSKELKKKRDSEDRLRQTSPQKVFFPDGFIDLSQFANKNHTHKFIDLTDAPNSYVADKFVKVNADGTALEYGDGGGGIAEIPQATVTTLGGIKASPKTSGETQEVKIDTATGKLYSTPPSSAQNGLPAGGSAGQILSKIDGTDYNSQWIDPSSGGGGGLMQSHVGMYIPTVPTSGLAAREALWQRFIALKNVKVTALDFSIFALTGKIKLLVYETNNWTGNATKGTLVYSGGYMSVATPPCIHKFSDLNIDLEKGKIYAFVFESEAGTTLQVSNKFDLTILGYGSLMPASAKGGYTTRAGTILTEYSDSIVRMIVTYG